MLKRAIQIVTVNLCFLGMLVGGFVGVAYAAGGFNAHMLSTRILGCLTGFGIAIGLLILAYFVSDRDAEVVMDNLIISLL